MLSQTKTSKISEFVVLLIPLFAFQFFQYRALPMVVLKMSGFLSSFALFILAFYSIFCRQYKRGTIPYYLKNIICITLLSFLMAWLFWNQPVPNTFRSSISYFNLCFFFFLVKYRISKATIVKLLVAYSVIVVFLWFYAVSQAPRIIFGQLGDDDFTELVNNRGGFRITILGTTLTIILYFYILSKAIIQKNKIYYILAFLLFVFNCTSLTRSNIASIAIATFVLFWYLYKNKLSFIVKVVSISTLAFFAMYYFFAENIDVLIDLTKSQFENGSEDSAFYRLKEYDFFFTEFNHSIFTTMFGNGAPNHSNLQIYLDKLKDKGYWLSDVNYANIFCTIGLLGLVMYILMVVKALRTRISKEALFAKAYIVYAILSTFTISTLLDSIPLAICLYWIYMDANQQQSLKLHSA